LPVRHTVRPHHTPCKTKVIAMPPARLQWQS